MKLRWLAYRESGEFYNAIFGGLNCLGSAKMTILPSISRYSVQWAIQGLALRGINIPFITRRYVLNRAKTIIDQLSMIPGESPGGIILFSDMICLERVGLSAQIKKLAPEVTIVYYLTDLVAADPLKQWLISHTSPSIDSIMTYDSNDARNYGLSHVLAPYEGIGSLPGEPICYDICFLGRSKGRIEKILSICERLTKNGFRCYFYIADLPNENEVHIPGMVYGPSISYVEYLEIVSKSRCILEIVQDGGSDTTLRFSEAVKYNKLLLSDCPTLERHPLYDPKYMQGFREATDIEFSTLRNMDTVDYEHKEFLSAERFINDVERNLGNEDSSTI